MKQNNKFIKQYNKILETLEKRKVIIGTVLIVVLIAGLIVNAYFDSRLASGNNSGDNNVIEKLVSDNSALKDRVEKLDKSLAEVTEKLNKLIEAHENPEVTTSTQVITEPSVAKVAGATASKTASTQTVSGKVNINSASLSQLDTLPGIGPTYAQRIIDYRTANGGFKSIEEIKNVKGIGDKTFEKFKDKITI